MNTVPFQGDIENYFAWIAEPIIGRPLRVRYERTSFMDRRITLTGPCGFFMQHTFVSHPSSPATIITVREPFWKAVIEAKNGVH